MYSRSAVRRKCIWQTILLILVASITMLAIFAAWLSFPPKNTPERDDVVVIMAGATDGRHDLGHHLVRSGVADNLVVSNPLGYRDPAGYVLCSQSRVPEHIETWCMDPLPPTTTGEAQTFDSLASQEGWDSVVVVTNRPHHRRVKLNFDRCTNVEATVVSIDDLNRQIIPYQVAREMGGFLKFWLTRPC